MAPQTVVRNTHPNTPNTMKKKTAKVPQGIHLKKSSKGFSMHIHADNGNKLAVLTGYNTKAAAVKSLTAVQNALDKAFGVVGGYAFTDHTKAPKKRTTPKK